MVKSADRTLRLFEAFSELGRPATLSEISRHLRIPVSSCHGLLRALEDLGYVYSLEPRSAYFPTKRLFEVASDLARHDPLGAKVSAALEKLRDDSGETVVLAKRRDDRVVFLEVQESRSNMRYVAHVGEVRPLHAGSLGKMLLALMPAEERAKLLKQLDYTRHTSKTLTSAKALEAAVAGAQERGWYANFGESMPDLYAIARGVWIDGNAYAVAVIGPGKRIEENQDRLGGLLARTCKAIGEAPRNTR